MCKFKDGAQSSCGKVTSRGITTKVTIYIPTRNFISANYYKRRSDTESTTTLFFKQADREEIVNKHNQLRAKVANGKEQKGIDGAQPKAANMRKMAWNDQLAEVAQRYFFVE